MGSSDMHESGNFSAFIAGALLGAGVALLLAPQSGSQMRGLLRDYASRAKDELDNAIEQATEPWDRAKERGQKFVAKGKESLREAGRHVKGFAEKGEKAVNETKEEFASQQR